MIEKTFETASGAIRYWVSHNGVARFPQLVFLPGLTADHRLFDRQIERFESMLPCLVWDPPAHAASRPYREISLFNWAETLHALLAAEGFDSPVLVGQSMGGYVAQAFIDRFPSAAAGLVAIDSAPLQRAYFSNWELWTLKRMGPVYRAIPWRLLLAWGSSGVARSAYGKTLMREMMERYDKRTYCDLAARGYRALAEAVEACRPYEIDCPALLICGERDRAGSVKRYNRRWHERSGIPLVWVPDAGHNSNTDRPDLVNRHLAEFLQQELGAKACRTTRAV